MLESLWKKKVIYNNHIILELDPFQFLLVYFKDDHERTKIR